MFLSHTSVRRKAAPILAVLLFLLTALLPGCSPSSQPVVPYQRFTAEPSPSDSSPSPEANRTNPEFDKLTEDLFQKWVTSTTINLHYSLKNPQAIGITPSAVTFGNYAVEQFKEDLVDLKDAKARLAAIDQSSLSDSQRLTFRILSAYLDTELRSEGLELYAQPLSPTIGIQAQLPVLLAEYDFHTTQDIEDYLNLLSQIDGYFGQLLNFQREKADAGLFMSDWMADQVIASCQGYLGTPEESFLSETFSSRLSEAANRLQLSEEQMKEYEKRNLEILTTHFIPAYQALIQGLETLKGSGTNQEGLCGYPEGKAYYEYLVASKIGPSYANLEELRKAIARQMADDLMAIRTAVTDDPTLADRLSASQFPTMKPDDMLSGLKTATETDFPELSGLTCTIKQVPRALEGALSPAFYLTPAIDQYADHTIYINPKYADSDLYPTMAHEGYPGHLYQSAYFFSQKCCNLRYLLSFSSYTEGWATYVEHLSYGFDNGLDKDCSQLMAHNSLATLGLYALLDINVNYYGWGLKETGAFLSSYGIGDADIAREIFYALAANPSNYLQYYAGCLEFLTMRAEAEKTLGPQFSAKEFHRMLLDVGPAPFTIVRQEFESWLTLQASDAGSPLKQRDR